MKTVMQHKFGQQAQVNISRSSFDRSHGYKTTFDAGKLIPIYCDEALPGDTHIFSMQAFARLATPIKPIMDNMYMDFFVFSVPIRIVWNNFVKFMGEQDNPGDSTDFTIPQIVYNNALIGSMADYMGIPTEKATPISVSAIWTRAYNLIWNEWFRDENLQNSLTVNKGNGPDNNTDYVLQSRGKRHDYFTSCLPFPQKGNAVSIPIGSNAPVIRTPSAPGWQAYLGATDTLAGSFNVDTVAGNLFTQSGAPGTISLDPLGGLEADLSAAISPTINSLRQAFQIQAMLERDARGGTRYTEKIRAHFGVTSPDSRLQRPEYLGGGQLPVNITPVQQTSETSGTPQGNLAGFGTANGKAVSFAASFTEHSVIIGLVSVRADLTYQQGIERQWLRQTQYDFFWPTLAQIGEQAVQNQEIFFDDITPANNIDTFGYQERYSEYRFKQSKITGLFRSDATGTLDVWHLSQDFAALPALNSVFITDNPPIDRIIVTPSEPQFLFDSYITLKSIRPMPMYGIPFNFARL